VLHSFSATTSNDNLIVKFDVSGLGNVTSANFTVTASADIVIKCINNGGHQPPGLVRTISLRSISGSFPAVNGRTKGTLIIQKPAASEFQSLAPPGMVAVSVDVLAYNNVQLIGPNGQVIKTVATVKS
jgi:hypothetical protein